MTFLPAAIWNAIAESQDLETAAAKIAFRLDGEELLKMENLWMKAEEARGTSSSVALSLRTCLPTMVERRAICLFVDEHPDLRDALVEMNNPQEAVYIMTRERQLNETEQKELFARLESSDAVDIWRNAAATVGRVEEVNRHTVAWDIAETLLRTGMLGEVQYKFQLRYMSFNPASESQEDVAEALAVLLYNFPGLIDLERLRYLPPEVRAEAAFERFLEGA